jgi:hypothetical protein
VARSNRTLFDNIVSPPDGLVPQNGQFQLLRAMRQQSDTPSDHAVNARASAEWQALYPKTR